MNTAEPVKFERSQIAPCGINCGTCLAFLREKNRCRGCQVPAENIPKSRLLCRIRNCERLANTGSKFCSDCEIFPCARLKQLDKRYSTKYHLSLVRNLRNIKELGITKFLANEASKWTCPNCGSTLCVHEEHCVSCKMENAKRPTTAT
jgi:hypothetical protein